MLVGRGTPALVEHHEIQLLDVSTRGQRIGGQIRGLVEGRLARECGRRGPRVRVAEGYEVPLVRGRPGIGVRMNGVLRRERGRAGRKILRVAPLDRQPVHAIQGVNETGDVRMLQRRVRLLGHVENVDVERKRRQRG